MISLPRSLLLKSPHASFILKRKKRKKVDSDIITYKEKREKEREKDSEAHYLKEQKFKKVGSLFLKKQRNPSFYRRQTMPLHRKT